MKTNLILLFGILGILTTQSLTQQKVIAHPHCDPYLDCYRESENLEKAEYWTNYFFKLIRPEMRNKQVRIHHTLYRRERSAIKQVVDRVLNRSCQRPHIDHYYFLLERDRNREDRESWDSYHRRDRLRSRLDRRHNIWHRYDDYDRELWWDEELWDDGYYWGRTEDYFFEGLYRELTDAVFYARHPELSRPVSRRQVMNWSSEWTFIRQHFADFEREKFIKQHLIPICDREVYENMDSIYR